MHTFPEVSRVIKELSAFVALVASPEIAPDKAFSAALAVAISFAMLHVTSVHPTPLIVPSASTNIFPPVAPPSLLTMPGVDAVAMPTGSKLTTMANSNELPS
jgi:hypothetical protein